MKIRRIEPVTYGELSIGHIYVEWNGPYVIRWQCKSLHFDDDGEPWYASFTPYDIAMPMLNRFGQREYPMNLRPYEMTGEGRHPLYRHDDFFVLLLQL